MILNNTVCWGDLCKVESKHVIHNNDLDTYLLNKKKGKLRTTMERKTNRSDSFESENKTFKGTDLDSVNGTFIHDDYNEDQKISTDTEIISDRRTYCYEEEYKMI